jgi:uncharacterized protein (DUF58 family)
VSAAPLLTPESIAQLRGLELRARQIVDGYVAGRHRSRLRGPSAEFAEYRDYAPGDDRRYVDWKAFAKHERLYVKQFQAETNLAVYLALDASESMQFRGPSVSLSKWEYAQALAAATAWLVIAQRDNVGLVVFDDEVRAQLPPAGTLSQLGLICERLEGTPVERATKYRAAFAGIAACARRRGVVLVISDFLGDQAELLRGLRQLRRAQHDVVALQLLDPAELEFPYDAPALFHGLETRQTQLVEPRSVRRAYLETLREALDAIAAECRRIGVDYALARTDEPFTRPLRRLLHQRAQRRGN